MHRPKISCVAALLSLCLPFSVGADEPDTSQEAEIVGKYEVKLPASEDSSAQGIHASHDHKVIYWASKRKFKKNPRLPDEAYSETYAPDDPSIPLAFIFDSYTDFIMMAGATNPRAAVALVAQHFDIDEESADKVFQFMAKAKREQNKDIDKWRKKELCPNGTPLYNDDAYSAFDRLQAERDRTSQKAMRKAFKQMDVSWESFEEALRNRYATRTSGFARYNHKPYWEASGANINERMDLICTQLAEENL